MNNLKKADESNSSALQTADKTLFCLDRAVWLFNRQTLLIIKQLHLVKSLYLVTKLVLF